MPRQLPGCQSYHLLVGSKDVAEFMFISEILVHLLEPDTGLVIGISSFILWDLLNVSYLLVTLSRF